MHKHAAALWSTRHSLWSTLLFLCCLGSPALATTKGLNQIVTPDVQPRGTLSISFQQVDPNIANRYEAQLEMGLTSRLEVAVFQGFSPDEQIFNAEYGIVQRKDVLLSAGFANYSTKGTSPQPYLEGGYLKGKTYLMAGIIRASVETSGVGGAIVSNHETQSILGAAYHITPRTLLQLDYQSGRGNFATAGFTYNITPQLQINPSAYLSNAFPHKTYGYVVLTWTITAFQ